MSNQCPRCASPRLGNYPFCATCGFDFRSAGAPAIPTQGHLPPQQPPGGTPKQAPAPAQLQANQPSAPAPAVALPVWAPTHLVPAAGMAFWAAPDGRQRPVGQLPGNLELVLEASAGAWAQVRAVNGWRGWVDGRLLSAKELGRQEALGQIGNVLGQAVAKMGAPVAQPSKPSSHKAAQASCIGVRFDIDKVNDGGYGEACWRIFWRAVDIQVVAGTQLLEGDTAASPDRENVYCLAFKWLTGPSRAEDLRAALGRSEEFQRVAAAPVFLDAAQVSREPLVEAGQVDRSGQIVGTSYRAQPAYLTVRKARDAGAAATPVGPQESSEVKNDALDLQSICRELDALLGSYLQSDEAKRRIHAIGEQLNEAGGMSLMRRVGTMIQQRDMLKASWLNNAWDGIGDWMS